MADVAEAPAAALDVPAAMREVVVQLQDHPERYRWFGVWWWPVKAVLRRLGYGPDQLYYLGRYQDPETAALVPVAGLQATLRAALEEFGQNARYPRSGGRVEAPDGSLVTIWDADAGL